MGEEMLQTTVAGASSIVGKIWTRFARTVTSRPTAVGPVVLKLEKFHRQVITNTLTTTTITVTTVTATATTVTETATEETASTQVHHDLIDTNTGALRGKNSANRGWSLRWCEFLLAAF